ncbi:helix-turn-helix transcriptional regulator [Pseudonocardia nigra]|uniref:helix-turn-helix transcriptional regulator n=1 Tax=Pseudonocardia nigra TaxID=1921578 RepID=UPI001C5FB98F|nr:LuxR C-terminal-related transcriptional regulator [Pseudonocardia nigra]
MRSMSSGELGAGVERVCREPGGAVALERAVAARLRDAVPFGPWCALTVDPASALPTGGYHRDGISPQLIPRLLEIEARAEDAFALPSLARHPRRAVTLADATSGHPDRSPRYHDVLRPAGLEHEMRLLFRSDGGIWGALVMFRGEGEAAFSTAEMRLVEEATAGVAAAIRREMTLTEIAHGTDEDGPGLFLLSGTLTPLHVTPAAQRWLTEVDDGVDVATGLPYSVLTLAGRAAAGSGPLHSRLRSRSGRWMTMHAERIAGEPAQVSVIVEPARPIEIARIIADAYQLTARERDVVHLLARGHSRQEIARLLALSPHTVDDHVKRVFGKLGVRSRAELTYRLFFDQHAPRIDADVPVGGTG